MYIVEATISFEAAHRLYDVDTYSKECRDSVHGHSYKVRVKVGRSKLNDAGMVVDFKYLKTIMKVIEDKYDHSIILRTTDPLVDAFRNLAPEQKLNVVVDSPTAEWMSEVFYNQIADELSAIDSELVVISASVQETEKNIATYNPMMPCVATKEESEATVLRQQLQSQFYTPVENGGAIPV